MKPNIHPTLVKAKVICACGHTWETLSTRDVLKTDLCSNCHPFYTGEMRIVDTAGQVERFMRRMGARNEQAAQPVLGTRRASKNRANVPPPPQERRPAASEATEGAAGEDEQMPA